MRNLKAYFDSFVIAIFMIGISGLVGWLLVVQPIQEYFQVGNWDRVPATILSVKMLEDSSGQQHVTSYECQASYRYQIGGKTYESSNVSIYSGSDNLSNFQQRIFDELSAHQKNGQPYAIYVNPQDPNDAVIFRSIRWGVTIGVSFVVLLFCGAGVVLLVKTGKEIVTGRLR